jgi:hypothetical protein
MSSLFPVHHTHSILSTQIFSDDARNPNNEPSKFSAYDFKGKLAQFELSDASASIDSDRSIFFASSITPRILRQRKRPSAFIAQGVRTRHTWEWQGVC